ncbi:MAG: beta-lactamase [Bryobacterales bacterium]|nr:beta-lactamase [Bryobacterales bacterium]
MTLVRSNKISRISLLLFIASPLVVSTAHGQNNDAEQARAREMDAYVAKAVRDWDVAGLAIAVVKDGHVVFKKAYGVREIGKPAAVDTSTLFAIASTTKAMTAASLAMLVDEKKVSWDDPVTKYIPSLQMYDPFVTKELTVRDLLTHRTGLGNADYMWGLNDYTILEIEQRLKLLKPEYSFRSSFIYQNLMYMLAGEVVAAASGMPWSQFVETRIMQPVGMRSSLTHERLVPSNANRATPHWRLGGDTLVVVHSTDGQAIGPAGGVWSNISDMSRWMLFLLDSGRVNGKRLIQPESYAEMFKPQVMVPPGEFYATAPLTKPHWTTYGLGWFQEDYNGRMLNFHTGSLDGFVSIIGLIQDKRFGVYVFANVDHAEIRHALMYKAIDLFLGDQPRDWSSELNAVFTKRRAVNDSVSKSEFATRALGTRPTLPLSKYAGSYQDSLFGRMDIVEKGGTLRLTAGRNFAGNLEHWENDTFRIHFDQAWQGMALVTFQVSNGVVRSLSSEGITLQRVDKGSAATH